MILVEPSHLGIDASLNFMARCGGSEFGMVVVEQVLADDGELKLWRRMPGNAHIKFPIGGHVLIRYLSDVAERDVELQVPRQVQRGAQQKLMTGVVRFGAAARRGAAGLRTEIDQ